jgi:hypothetical protein
LFKLAGLSIPPEILKEQLQFALDQGIILPVAQEADPEDMGQDKVLVATKEMIALEKACLYLVEKDKNVLPPLINASEISKTLEAIKN